MKCWEADGVGSGGVMTPAEQAVARWLCGRCGRCGDAVLMASIAGFSVDSVNKQPSILLNKQFSVFDARF